MVNRTFGSKYSRLISKATSQYIFLNILANTKVLQISTFFGGQHFFLKISKVE